MGDTVPQGVTFDAAPAAAPQQNAAPAGVTFDKSPVPAGVTFDQTPAPPPVKQSPTVGQPKTFMEKATNAIGGLVEAGTYKGEPGEGEKGAGPALEVLKKYTVDPFTQLGEWGHEYGGKAGLGAVTAATGETQETVRKEHPVAAGIAEGIGGAAGSIAADPRNWPFMAKSVMLPILNKLMHAGFTTMMTKSAHDALTNLAENWDNMSPEEKAKNGTEAGLTTMLATATALHLTGQATDATKAAFKKAVTPEGYTTKTVGPAEVPVRPTSTMARVAEARQPEMAKQFVQEQTAPAVAEGVSKTIQQASGIEGDHARTTEDPYGLASMSDVKAKEYQVPVQRIDALSDNAFSNAQMARERVGNDFSKAGKEEWKKQSQALTELWETHRPQLEAEGIDVDEAKKAWGQKSALDTIEKAMRKTTDIAADPARPYDLKMGKTLGTTIKNLLQHDDAPFQKLFGSKYAEAKPVLEEFARTLNEQSQIAGNNQTPMDAFLSKFGRKIMVDGLGAVLGGAFGGGEGLAVGTVAGHLGNMAYDRIADSAAKWYMTKALTIPKATELLNNSMKLGADPAKVSEQLKTIIHNSDPKWTDTISQRLSELWHDVRGEAGMPDTIYPEGFQKAPTAHSQDLRDFSKDYTNKDIDTTKAPKDSRGEDIADAYDKMQHDPNDPKVKAAYDALIKETKSQWQGLKDRGYTMSTAAEQPYANSDEMLKDIRDNKHITVWEGGQPPADHPMSSVDEETGHSNNTLFRAVHDILGHGKEGHDFSEAGEENAFRQHAQMYSNAAQPALATETKGQASWAFNHEGVRNGSSQPGDMFPEQKAALLPSEFHGGKGSEVLDHVKAGKPFSVLTAENPMNNRLSDTENAKLNAQLLGELRDKGYKPVSVEGHNRDVEGQKEHSFFVPNITAEDSAALGRKYKQASILTHEGLHDLTKDTVNPSDNGKLLTGNAATKEPYYSTVNGKPFSVPLDFDKEVPATKNKTMNASGESSASIEAQHRLQAQQAQGLQVYDVDSRKAGSKDAWHPVMASVDRVDQTAQPFHHLVEIDPKTGATTIIDSGKGAKPLPSDERIQSLLGQAVPETPALTRPAATKNGKIEPKEAQASTTASPTGSTVRLMKSPLKVKAASGENPITTDVAVALNDYTNRKLTSLKLNEATPEAMIKRAKPILEDEARYQLAQDNSGQAWYTEQMDEHDRIAQEMRPALKDPVKLSLFKMAEAVLSSGQKPYRNFTATMEAFDHYSNTGEFPPLNPETGHSWGPREEDAYGNAFQTINHLVTQLGEKGAVDWLMGEHPVSELTALKKEISGTSSSRVSGKSTDMRKGVLIFGEKRGPFALNLRGQETEFTADMWVSRTWNRWMGTLEVSPRNDAEMETDAPRSQRERALMKQSFEEVGNKLGLSTSSLQAVLWYYEQALYSAHGVPKESWSFSAAAKRAQMEGKQTSMSFGNKEEGDTSFNPEEMK